MKSIYGTIGSIMKSLPNLSYKEILWGISYPELLRMVADLPRQIKLTEEEARARDYKTLSKGNVSEFKGFLDGLKAKQKKKHE